MLLRLSVEERVPYVVVTATGDLDVSTAGTLATAVSNAFSDGYAGVLVDLAGVSFVDSNGITALLAGHRAARRADGRFALVAPSPQVRRVLALHRLDRDLPAYASVALALAGPGDGTVG
ncbi:MAG: STAS domain-containing protein [Nocardioidaceae bacterium]|nr:STAS domain-containing protein [Nocardioidaceae bacterium]NUS51488.1 STAS domain-containing protein [Nocardioidaceae bacterium]